MRRGKALWMQSSPRMEGTGPVVQRRRKKQSECGSSGGSSQMDVNGARQYEASERIPGNHVRCGCSLSNMLWTPIIHERCGCSLSNTLWTPIILTPISYRTKSIKTINQ